MSYFDSNQNVGFIMIIAGLVMALCAVLSIVLALGHGWWFTYALIGGIGTIIGGLLLFLFGTNVRNESNSSPIPGIEFILTVSSFDVAGVLSSFVRFIGIVGILMGIFNAIATFTVPYYGGAGSGIMTAIMAILFGLFFIWASPQILGEDKGVDKKIIWIVLLVLFALSILGGLMALTSLGWGAWFAVYALSNLVMAIVYVYALLALLSPEVRANMGA
jgi:flagellar basal body-associated protein FliL